MPSTWPSPSCRRTPSSPSTCAMAARAAHRAGSSPVSDPHGGLTVESCTRSALPSSCPDASADGSEFGGVEVRVCRPRMAGASRSRRRCARRRRAARRPVAVRVVSRRGSIVGLRRWGEWHRGQGVVGAPDHCDAACAARRTDDDGGLASAARCRQRPGSRERIRGCSSRSAPSSKAGARRCRRAPGRPPRRVRRARWSRLAAAAPAHRRPARPAPAVARRGRRRRARMTLPGPQSPGSVSWYWKRA